MNRKNLETLANYLESGELKAELDMATYSDGKHARSAVNCGSVGCAIGHGPYAGIPKHRKEIWRKYSYRVFNLTLSEWKWCFSACWTHYDNTPEGAAKRIRYLLTHGAPPEDFLEAPPWYRSNQAPPP